MKRYCFECKFLRLERDKDGEITGLKLCPLWGNTYHADFQPACELFEDKGELDKKD